MGCSTCPTIPTWRRIAIRSAYRSREVNALGNRMQREGKAGYNCATNEANAGMHIWDMRDAEGHMGAMACVVVPRFWDQHQKPGDWQILARWIDENLPYSQLWFYPTYWAVNIGWQRSRSGGSTAMRSRRGGGIQISCCHRNQKGRLCSTVSGFFRKLCFV